VNEFPEIAAEYEKRASCCLTKAMLGIPEDRNLWRAFAGELLDRAADTRALFTLS
jgi:hypothetical protein